MPHKHESYFRDVCFSSSTHLCRPESRDWPWTRPWMPTPAPLCCSFSELSWEIKFSSSAGGSHAKRARSRSRFLPVKSEFSFPASVAPSDSGFLLSSQLNAGNGKRNNSQILFWEMSHLDLHKACGTNLSLQIKTPENPLCPFTASFYCAEWQSTGFHI